MSADPRNFTPAPVPEIIEATAASWLSLRDRGMSAAETAEFMRWLQQDPRHAATFAELDRAWKDFDKLGAVPESHADPDPDLLAPRVRTRHHGFSWMTIGAAAAAIAVLLAVFQFRPHHHAAETVIGAFQKFDLPDGSVAQLNTNSAIDVSFNSTERRVRVARGEVFFAVTKDPARPFIVTAGSVAVRAVGTAFNVRQCEGAIEVLVTEGKVSVKDTIKGRSLLAPMTGTTEPALLVAGERAIVSTPAGMPNATPAFATVAKLSAAETQRALAWQERRLEFDSTPLAEVVREFNRYNRQQIVITDAALAAKRFSGIFRADGYETLVRLLEADFGATVTREEDEILLQSRH